MSRLPSLEANQVKEIALKYIHPTDQIRKTFNEQSLKELADDILLRGIEQPLTVTPNGGGGWNIKHGERRYRAAELAGLEKVPVILVKKETGEGAELNRLFDQYAENIQREDLNFIDLAYFFKSLRDDHKIKVSDIPDLLMDNGLKEMSRSYISNIIRLLDLPEWVTDRIIDGTIPPGHAKYMMPMLDCEKVTATVKEEIESYFKNENPYMAFSHDFIKEMVNDAYADIHPSVERVRDWGPEENQTLFELDALTGDEKTELKTRKIVDECGNTYIYALNHEAHKKFNSNKPAGKSKRVTSSSSSNTDKSTPGVPEQRLGPSDERLQSYLHQWLEKWIADCLYNNIDEADAAGIQNKLILWIAFGSPNSFHHSGWIDRDTHNGAQSKASTHFNETGELKPANMNSYLNFEGDQLILIDKLVDEVIFDMSFKNSCALANYLKLNIETRYIIDDDYISMYTKPGIGKLAKATKLDQQNNWPTDPKIKDLREYCCKEPSIKIIGCPKDIITMYHSGLEK